MIAKDDEQDAETWVKKQRDSPAASGVDGSGLMVYTSGGQSEQGGQIEWDVCL